MNFLYKLIIEVEVKISLQPNYAQISPTNTPT
jgi:hypothetical protein